ncbi:MAG: alpha-ketoacid dehydrogenase subunit beta [Candidatus Pacearchaeota archaeon]|jgi:pyruvate dehydrogenase E1 component beta subunit
MLKTYSQIINETLDEELKKDDSIFLIGEDIGVYGGAFGVTKGLFEKYGRQRIIDSPMSEQAITGLAVGAAINGLKPIVEIMFMDFVTLIYDQLMNHASIFNYLSDGKVSVPLVIRVPAGGGRGYGATHSKSLLGPLMHIPNIKIVAPSNAKEVRGLLRASILDKNPVIFVEHKLLYSLKEEIGEAGELEDFIPLGKANIVKTGKDLLIISFSKQVLDCVEVANKLEKEGISIEVLDLRTIKPLDVETIKKSVEKIGKVLIVEEGYSDCGVASEIISKINECCFYSLSCPIKRVCTTENPIPCSSKLERETLPNIDRIESAVRGILND